MRTVGAVMKQPSKNEKSVLKERVAVLEAENSELSKQIKELQSDLADAKKVENKQNRKREP